MCTPVRDHPCVIPCHLITWCELDRLSVFDFGVDGPQTLSILESLAPARHWSAGTTLDKLSTAVESTGMGSDNNNGKLLEESEPLVQPRG